MSIGVILEPKVSTFLDAIPCCCQVNLSLLLPSRSVSLLPFLLLLRRRAVGMWEPLFFSGFQGLWEGWETGQLYRPVFHAFHQTGISTAFGAGWIST